MDAPDDTLRTPHLPPDVRHHRVLTALIGLLLIAGCTGCMPRRWSWWRQPDAVAAPGPQPPAAAPPQSPSSPSDLSPLNYQEPAQPPGYDADRQPGQTETDNTTAYSQSPDDEPDPTCIVARVGDEVILAGDVYGPINQALARHPDPLTEEELSQLRAQLLRQQLPSVIETKMLYVAYLRWLEDQSKGKGDISVAMPKIWEHVHQKFDEEELPELLKQHKVETPAQLDAALRQYGWSLAKQRRYYGERNLGMAAARERVLEVPETTHEEMLAYYEEHIQDYEFSAQARWEQLTASFDKYPTKQEALRAIEQMGNAVALGGAPLHAVAKRSSDGFSAENGGQNDWINQGSLASEMLDQAIFSLPVGELSRIIEDESGFHIVRVLERREAGRTSFLEAQVDIKKSLEEEKRKAAFQQYMAELQRTIPVWTIYDGWAAGVAEPSE